MNVLEVARILSGKLMTAADNAGSCEVRGAYCSDLLSDVMANSNESDLWITLQRHVNIVAVAHLKGLSGVVIVNGREPEAETTARAEAERIPIIVTALSAFEAAGILYGLGIRGRGSA